MGMFTSTHGEVRVVAAPFLSLPVDLGIVEVAEKDLDKIARFLIPITWDAGYDKPVYLMVAGFSEGVFKISGVSIMDPTEQYGIVPNGTLVVELEMDMAATVNGAFPFDVGAYEDAPTVA